MAESEGRVKTIESNAKTIAKAKAVADQASKISTDNITLVIGSQTNVRAEIVAANAMLQATRDTQLGAAGHLAFAHIADIELKGNLTTTAVEKEYKNIDGFIIVAQNAANDAIAMQKAADDEVANAQAADALATKARDAVADANKKAQDAATQANNAVKQISTAIAELQTAASKSPPEMDSKAQKSIDDAVKITKDALVESKQNMTTTGTESKSATNAKDTSDRAVAEAAKASAAASAAAKLAEQANIDARAAVDAAEAAVVAGYKGFTDNLAARRAAMGVLYARISADEKTADTELQKVIGVVGDIVAGLTAIGTHAMAIRGIGPRLAVRVSLEAPSVQQTVSSRISKIAALDLTAAATLTAADNQRKALRLTIQQANDGHTDLKQATDDIKAFIDDIDIEIPLIQRVDFATDEKAYNNIRSLDGKINTAEASVNPPAIIANIQNALAQATDVKNAITALIPAMALAETDALELEREANTRLSAVQPAPPTPPPLTASERLIHPPASSSETLTMADGAATGANAQGPVVLVASSEKELADKLRRSHFAPVQRVYALIIDKPGKISPLLRAAATDLGVNVVPPEALTDSAMTEGATGWLYRIADYGDPDNSYKQLINYVKPAMYAANP